MDIEALAGGCLVELQAVEGVPSVSLIRGIREICGRYSLHLLVAEIQDKAAKRLVARRETVRQLEVGAAGVHRVALACGIVEGVAAAEDI